MYLLSSLQIHCIKHKYYLRPVYNQEELTLNSEKSQFSMLRLWVSKYGILGWIKNQSRIHSKLKYKNIFYYPKIAPKVLVWQHFYGLITSEKSKLELFLFQSIFLTYLMLSIRFFSPSPSSSKFCLLYLLYFYILPSFLFPVLHFYFHLCFVEFSVLFPPIYFLHFILAKIDSFLMLWFL